VRIASYNVRNLFSASEAGDRGVPARSEADARALAGTIGAVNADVLLMQEVGSVAALEEINDLLGAPYPFLDVPESNSSRGIHLGILSREPFELHSFGQRTLTDTDGAVLEEYETEADASADNPTPLKVQRDLMLAEVTIEGLGVLAIFNVHLKSKTNRPWRLLAADVIRAAECRLLAEVITGYLADHPERPLLLAGDFNDTRRSDALAPLFELPMSDPLGDSLEGTNRNPSTYWPKRRMRLDFVLTSATARRLLVKGSEQIHRSQRARRASDHYPVSVDLDYVDE
jgi:endonuclease/exonuclease/phosphatase family metal-dependent hydrolase